MKPVIFGEVLFDRFPDGRVVLGGAPFNVAWNLQALGLPPRLVSRVGDDALGEHILEAMSAWGMDTSGVQVDPARPTGTVEVSFAHGEPGYEIATGAAWDHIAGDEPSAELGGGGVLYHGSLAARADGMDASRAALHGLREAACGRVFVDVNLRDPWWQRGDVLGLLRGARWAKLNDEELGLLVPEHGEREARAAGLVAQCGLEAVVVTLGAEGAAAYGPDGPICALPADVPAEVVDTVGAGDAFSAVTLLGLLRGWGWPRILARAQSLAGAVVALRGATTNERAFYDKIANHWESA